MTFFPKENRILTALKKGETPLGMEVYTGDPSIIEILAYTGFDFYMLDMEHAPVNVETMKHCIRAADASNISTVVRVAENNTSLILQATDLGVQGIIVPHIKNKLDAKKALESLRYPPEGKRGSCPSIRAASYSTPGWDDYLNFQSKNLSFIALLEDIEAIENIEEIFAELRPGIDAVLFGRGDLAQALTKPGEKVNWDHPYILEAFNNVVDMSRKTGVPTMAVPWPKASIQSAKETIKQGADICMYSIDQLLFQDICLQIIQEMKK